MNVSSKTVPKTSSFTTAPLRNRIRVDLIAPVPEVWAVVGELTRFPEYSFGLEKVVARSDSNGAPTEYVCHFKPREEGGVGISERNIIRWFEPNRGYASSGAEANAFGLTNDLHVVSVEPSEEGTILTCDENYDAQDLEMCRTEFESALANMGENLVRRFGGAIVTRYVDR